MKVCCILLVFVAGAFGSSPDIYINIFPKIPKCSRNHPYLNECLATTVQYMKEELRHGSPELGVPSLDPYHIDYINENFDGINFEAWNIKVEGATGFAIKEFKLQLTKTSFDLKVAVVVPQIIGTGYYKCQKKMFFLPVESEGGFEVVFSDIKVVVAANGKLIQKHGRTYLDLKKFDSSILIQDAHIRRLDGGVTANIARKWLENDKWSTLRNLNSAVNNQIKSEVRKYIQKALKKYPLDLVVV